MEELALEKENLKNILTKYDEYLDDTKLEFKNVYKLYANKEEAEKRHQYLKNKIHTLETNIQKPYFARIDFKNNNGIKDICYIGKVGISNYDNEIVTVDWRAPISSLYYDSNIGPAEYTVGDETIKGSLDLKRQYDIQNRELINYFDVDTVSNDELLKPYLGVNADSRVKNIVSTIQKEQNEIIRESIAKNIIVQGVAGGGKTAVALHRIAYLEYNYRDTISPDQYMVITPNKFFSEYIAKILPDLDVNDVAQYDLIELTENFIGEKLELQDDFILLNKYMNGKCSNLSKLKTSLTFKNIIDNYFIEYFKNAIKNKPIKINDFVVIDVNTIKKYWNEILKRDYDNLNSAVERCVLLLNKHFNNNKDNILTRLNKYIDEKIEESNDLDKYRKERETIKNKINSSMTSTIKNYFKPLFKKSTALYSNIKRNIAKYTDNNDIILNIDNTLSYEDLPSLIYIHYKINGAETYEKYKHIAIDEAQDYNDFTFYAMKKIFPKASFSIYGDLAQSIFPYRSLETWNSVKEKVFDSNIEIKHLGKSYRTTIEIMNAANQINKHLNLPDASAVIRHGEDVKYINSSSPETIKSYIDELLKKGGKDIAIISKTLEQSEIIYSKLKDTFEINNITNKEQHFNNGICTIPCHLCKGLEFDSVIINNADETNFSSNNNLDMKLLYVAMTRAMHILIITYNNILPNCLDIKN